MEREPLLTALARDGATFAEACEAAGPDAAVPACPGWSVADLMWHLAEVHHFWRTVVAEQRDTWEGHEPPSRPSDAELSAFYRAGLAATIAVLSGAPFDQDNWTWTSDHSAGWVVRRMAQETAVHCSDALQAAGRDPAIEAELASDGIDEFLQYFLEGRDGAEPAGGSVHLHCTDVAGEWTVRPQPDGTNAVAREHAKGDCALRGAASDLLLVLWRRLPVAAIDVVGDGEVAARFLAFPALE
ncbi:MAG: maleylpyruvate isomerase family mycothiol-dependent enzyme [Actinomycetota bacterium]|nr:maleylpyruvate isomerase family mycothiol-dependent enzyme [Actinomycetota bacterium]